jgi:hypothetical protein
MVVVVVPVMVPVVAPVAIVMTIAMVPVVVPVNRDRVASGVVVVATEMMANKGTSFVVVVAAPAVGAARVAPVLAIGKRAIDPVVVRRRPSRIGTVVGDREPEIAHEESAPDRPEGTGGQRSGQTGS